MSKKWENNFAKLGRIIPEKKRGSSWLESANHLVFQIFCSTNVLFETFLIENN